MSAQQCGILQNLQSAAAGTDCICHHAPEGAD
jgi:hypothetical protein